MGIRGMKRFVEFIPHLLSPHELHDTYIIIDGNNFLFKLYHEINFGVDYLHGGDFDAFRQNIIKVFSVFQQCNITPIVIFDGGSPADDSKKETILRRAKDQNDAIVKFDGGRTPKITLLPVLASEVLYDTLRELKVVFAKCDFEADNEIVVLAKLLEAPVLSEDSDFYIYDNPHGFIPFDTMNFECVKNKKTGKRHLGCKLFKVANYKFQFPNLSISVLPIFSALLGNDYVGLEFFKTVHSKVFTEYEKSDVERKYKMLQWLEKKDADEAIKSVQECMQKKYHQETAQILRKVISVYQDETSSCVEYIQELLKDLPQNGLESWSPRKDDFRIFPRWFQQLARRGFLSSFLFDCVLLGRKVYRTQVEVIREDSIYSCSLILRKHIYAILKQISDFNGTVEEYLRMGADLRPQIVHHDPDFLPYFGEEYRLHGYLKEGRYIYFKMMGVSEDFANNLPLELALLLAVLVYWKKNSGALFNPQHLNSVLMSMLYFGLILPMISKQQSPLVAVDVELMELSKDVTKENAISANGHLEQFVLPRKLCDLEVVHNYFQLQTCLFFALNLRRLLFQKKNYPSKFTLFNGSFIYSFNLGLQTVKDPNKYISGCLGDSLYALLCFLRNYICKQ